MRKLAEIAFALVCWAIGASAVGWVLYATAVTCAWHLGVLVK